MKKPIGKALAVYITVWAVAVAVFNTLAFAVSAGTRKLDGTFFVGYTCITLAFLLQLLAGYLAFRVWRLGGLFHRLSLVTASYAGLFLMLLVGGTVMVIPALPTWVGTVLCVPILGFEAIAIIKARAAVDTVSATDARTERRTALMRRLTADAEALVVSARTDVLRAEAKRVCEALRYSDPTTNAALEELDSEIARELLAFADALNGEDEALARATADSLVTLIGRRSRRCKALK